MLARWMTESALVCLGEVRVLLCLVGHCRCFCTRAAAVFAHAPLASRRRDVTRDPLREDTERPFRSFYFLEGFSSVGENTSPGFKKIS